MFLKETDELRRKDRTFLLYLLSTLLLFLFNRFIVCSFLCFPIYLSVYVEVSTVFDWVFHSTSTTTQLHFQSTVKDDYN